MFSGIVLSVGTIGEYVQKNEGAVLVVNTEKDLSGFEDGESIAVNGVCLTVVDSTETTFKLDLSTETLSRTNFKSAKKGDRVNLERSLTPSAKISGHFVTSRFFNFIALFTFITLRPPRKPGDLDPPINIGLMNATTRSTTPAFKALAFSSAPPSISIEFISLFANFFRRCLMWNPFLPNLLFRISTFLALKAFWRAEEISGPVT